MKTLLILTLPVLFLVGFAQPTSATADADVEFTQLTLGSKTTVTGNFLVNGMYWPNTKHVIELADGRIKKNRWYQKKLGKRFFEETRPDFSKKVRYNCVGFPGVDIKAITIKIKDVGDNLLCKETFTIR